MQNSSKIFTAFVVGAAVGLLDDVDAGRDAEVMVWVACRDRRVGRRVVAVDGADVAVLAEDRGPRGREDPRLTVLELVVVVVIERRDFEQREFVYAVSDGAAYGGIPVYALVLGFLTLPKG